MGICQSIGTPLKVTILYDPEAAEYLFKIWKLELVAPSFYYLLYLFVWIRHRVPVTHSCTYPLVGTKNYYSVCMVSNVRLPSCCNTTTGCQGMLGVVVSKVADH